MTNVIEVEHLVKSYGDFTAVRDLSFAVRPGEVFCLLGPNGAGKTTTTEILEGYRDRSAGSVSVLGFDPGDGDRAFRERIGIVLQECGVQADLTVAEVLDMYGRYYPRRLPTADVIDLVELDAKATDRVGQLSGGQRRRLDIGLALIGDPDLIFLDEPTTGFDPSARRHSWSTIRALCGLGKTVLLTTHFMDEAEALADRIAVVAGGRIVAEGTPADLGGRNRARSAVEATLPAHLPVALPGFGPAEVTVLGDRVRIVGDDGVAITHRLTTWAVDNRLELAGLTVSQPSLEDIYLALTDNLADPRVAPTKETHR
ncbi:MAG: ABC transporter ATP-binding protein [Acidimicrobiales bacterium]